MIVAAAICPCPPLLAAELAGQAEVLPELRAACSVAVATLVAAAPDLVAVAGADARTRPWPPDGRLNVAAFAPAVGGGEAGRPPLPLPLGMGARLLDEAGYRGPRAFQGIAVSATSDACQRLGAQLAASAPRVALLAMGDGSGRRSVAAPGYLDERAWPFDAAVERAVRDGDLAALAAIDPGLAAELLAAGRPGWQALAGAFGAGAGGAGAGAGKPGTEVLYCDAPFGVGYLTATLTP